MLAEDNTKDGQISLLEGVGRVITNGLVPLIGAQGVLQARSKPASELRPGDLGYDVLLFATPLVLKSPL